MHDHKRRDSLRPAMNRRMFLATMGVAAGSVVLGTPLPGRRAWADQPAGAAFKLSVPEPSPKYGVCPTFYTRHLYQNCAVYEAPIVLAPSR